MAGLAKVTETIAKQLNSQLGSLSSASLLEAATVWARALAVLPLTRGLVLLLTLLKM